MGSYFFMFCGGINFAVYYIISTLNFKKILYNEELRFYLKIIIAIALFYSFSLIFLNNGYTIEECFRYGFFNCISLITTTGYCNIDYELFPNFLQAVIFLTLFIGASSGSTSGGIKIYRIILFLKSIVYELQCILTSSIITSVKVNKIAIENDILKKTLTFIVIYFFTFVVGGLLLFSLGIEFFTAFSVSVSCISNVGPALAEAGPTDNFFHFNTSAKFICSVLMILGRLEFYTVLALFYPYFSLKKS